MELAVPRKTRRRRKYCAPPSGKLGGSDSQTFLHSSPAKYEKPLTGCSNGLGLLQNKHRARWQRTIEKILFNQTNFQSIS
jgi:hypothetical protein